MRSRPLTPILPPLLTALTVWLISGLPGCMPRPGTAAGSHDPGTKVDAIAESYVRLALRLGLYDPDYVDAYIGPPEWIPTAADTARAREIPVIALRVEAGRLLKALEKIPPDERTASLRGQLTALIGRIDLLAGAGPLFDDESRDLFGMAALNYSLDSLDAALQAVDAFIPGTGSLAPRVEAWRARFVVPPDRIDAVFRAAIDEARRRTAAHIALPAEERFSVEYVGGVSWGAYNWYRGGYHSLIQVNTDLPFHASSALELAAHEGYPGHHVQNVLLDSTVVRGRGWKEFSVFPLFGPASLLNEGAAQYGVRLAFPDSARLAFERDVLFPLAGLDPALAEESARFRELTRRLRGAGIECARRYLDGRMSREAAIAFSRRYGLESPKEAEQSVRFYEQYRSYVITYVVGEDLVQGLAERTSGGQEATFEARWDCLRRLAAFPVLPSHLIE